MESFEKLMEVTKKIRHIAKTVADLDNTRPRYHFHAPAQWGDDPSGFAFCNGYYHMMYGSNPDSFQVGSGMPYRTPDNRWSPDEPEYFDSVALWGHARSKDMIHWEHMPCVCYPDIDNDEYFIWWGCTQINDDGVPVIIYTSLGRTRGPADGAEQRMLIGDPDLITWEHYKKNPIMTKEIHGEHMIYQWRDPFIFRNKSKVYMVLGGKLDESEGGECVVLLYEAGNSMYSEWKYRGIFFKYPGDARKSMECPLVACLGGRWVLIVSPHGPVEYFVGDIDFETGEFKWETRGFVDRGFAFYAPNLVYDDKGRCIIFGAVEGFKNTKGWNGVMSVPREIVLTEDGQLREIVPEEYKSLRKEMFSLKDGESAKMNVATFEVEAILDADKITEIEVVYGDNRVKVTYKNHVFHIGEREFNAKLYGSNAKLQMYFDISAVDILMNETESLVLVVPSCTDVCEVKAKTTDPNATIITWQYEAEDLFSYFKID